MTVAEVAQQLKLTEQTVRNWIDQGSLPAVRLGSRRVRIWRDDFERLIQDGYSGRAAVPRLRTNIWEDEVPDPALPPDR